MTAETGLAQDAL